MESIDKPVKLKSLKKEEYKKHIKLEEMPEEFFYVYKELRNKHFENIEILRKKNVILRYILAITLFLFVICLLAIFVIQMIFENDIWVTEIFFSLIFTVPFIFISLIFVQQSVESKYLLEYKNKIISTFIELLNPKFLYRHFIKRARIANTYNWREMERNKEIMEHYLDADFDGKTMCIIEENERVEGFTKEKFYFSMSDLLVMNEYTLPDGKTVSKKIFEGLFCWTEIENNLNTCLKININKNNKINYQVRMDSSEFENLFDIYCDDKILAMRILTADIMELLIKFYNQYYIPFEICCRNNKLYVRFFIKDMFEPTLLKDAMDIKVLYMHYAILDFTVQFNKKINKIISEIDV